LTELDDDLTVNYFPLQTSKISSDISIFKIFISLK